MNEATPELDYLYSARAANIKQSAVRDVFDISMREGLISLAGGNPYLQSLPLEKLGNLAHNILAQEGMTALQYGNGQGTSELREAICHVMAEEFILDASPENVVVTAGSQSALDITCKVFCDPHDVVLCEDPTYVGALNTFEANQVAVHPVRVDEHGLVPEALQEAIVALRAEGKTVKLLYTIPSFNNPSGITLSAERRQQIVNICKQEGLLVIEDNPYGMLKFEGEFNRPMRADNPEDVLYLGSFSKIFAPGLRVGWALVPERFQRRFYLANEAVILCPPTLNQMLVTSYLENHDWKGQVATYRELYAKRCAAMIAALEEFMPESISWTVPEGGFFVWLTLPEGVDTYPLLHTGIEAGVVFIPGAAFSPTQENPNQLRLAFSAVDEESIREGVKRLAPVLIQAIAAAEGAAAS